MNSKNIIFIGLFLVFSLLLSSCGAILASDVTPPPNAESFEPVDEADDAEITFPLLLPDPSRGEAIYIENCANCHGVTGMGDGEQADDLSVRPAALGDAALVQSAKPVDWYLMVTNGDLERSMPGYSSLDNRSRWDVVAYAMSLSTKEDLALGQSIYAEKCQACHGTNGEGTASAPRWKADTSLLAIKSLDDLAGIISNGQGQMPAFSGQLDREEINAVSIAVRWLGFASGAGSAETLQPEVGMPAASATSEASVDATPTVNVEPTVDEKVETSATTEVQATVTAISSDAADKISFIGSVVHGGEKKLPENLIVRLDGYDGMEETFRTETNVAVDGSFIFENIDNIPDRTYIAVLDYEGMTFNSDFYECTGDIPGDPIIFRITYYETTTSLANLRAERMHLFLDFSNPEVVQVAELFILSNSGNEIITATEVGGPVINIDLPAGAINLQFEGGELGQRFIQTEKGFADTEVINPGGGEQLLFGYELPYNRKSIISLPIPLDIDSAIIMLPNNGVSLKSEQLQETGARDVQGVSLALFTAANLKAGSTLELTVSGRPSAGISLETGNTTAIAIGAGVLGVVLLGIGFWLLQQRKKKLVPVLAVSAMVPESPDDLIDQIIALDDLYRSGNIPDEAYFSRRKELKAHLKEITE